MRYTRLYFFLLFCFASFASTAQEAPWRLGLTAGGSQYIGDLNPEGTYAPPFWQNPELQDLSFSAFAEKSLVEGVSLQLRYAQGALEANDRARDFQGNLQRNAPYFERALNMRSEWYSADLSFRLQTGTQTWLRPYVMIGFGGQYFQTYADLFTEEGQRYYYWNDGNIYDAPQGSPNANQIEQDGIYETELQPLSTEQRDYNSWDWQLPLAGGLDVKITPRIFLQLEYRWILSGSDYLDDVSTDYPETPFSNSTAAYASNPSNYQGRRGTEEPRLERNDMYSQVQIGFVVHLGRMHRSFQPPVFYTPPIGTPKNQGVPEVPKAAKSYLERMMQVDSTTEQDVPKTKNNTPVDSSTSSRSEPYEQANEQEIQFALLKSLREERLKSLSLQAELLRMRQANASADSLRLKQREAQLAQQRSIQLAQAAQRQEDRMLNDSLQKAVQQLKREANNLRKLAQVAPTAALDSSMVVTRRAEIQVEQEVLSTKIERMPESSLDLVFFEDAVAPGSLSELDSTQMQQDVDSLKAAPNSNEATAPRLSTAEKEKIERLDGLKAQLDDMQADLKKQRQRGELDSAYYAQLQQQMRFLNRVIDQLTADVEERAAPAPAPEKLDDKTLWREMQSQRSLLKEQAAVLRELKEDIRTKSTAEKPDSSQTALDWLQEAEVQNLYFPRGGSSINKQQFQRLQGVLANLKRFPRIHLQLQGYSDTTGTELENYRLSRARANAVAAYFRKQGIAAERLQVVYFGSTKAKGDDQEERRVEMHFSLK